MPLVMVDTNIALRATLPIPGGAARKLWVLFAYGAAKYRAQHLALDVDELNSAQIQTGGRMHTSNEQITAAEDAVARFEEQLPVDTPSDWVLAGSQACWDEYEVKAYELAKIFKRRIDAELAGRLMRRYQSVCVVTPNPAYAANVPQLTSDRDDDLLVFDALRVGAEIFISDDSDVVPDEANGIKLYEHGESRLQAMRFEYFLDHYCGDIDWREIDGGTI